ncbi:autophagy-related protein [Aspergillus floccosus]
MEPRRTPPEYFLEVFADTTSVRDVLKGILNLIFFHRYFPSIHPSTLDVLDFTLPAIKDADLDTLIDSRISALIRQHSAPAPAAPAPDSPSSGTTTPNGVRGRLAVEFYEKKRRRSGIWFGGLAGKAEEEVCWEVWNLDVTVATPRTESERAKVRKAMENMLHKAALKILAVVNRDKDHIPPITTSDSNPFPYRIVLNPRSDGWQNRFGLY